MGPVIAVRSPSRRRTLTSCPSNDRSRTNERDHNIGSARPPRISRTIRRNSTGRPSPVRLVTLDHWEPANAPNARPRSCAVREFALGPDLIVARPTQSTPRRRTCCIAAALLTSRLHVGDAFLNGHIQPDRGPSHAAELRSPANRTHPQSPTFVGRLRAHQVHRDGGVAPSVEPAGKPMDLVQVHGRRRERRGKTPGKPASGPSVADDDRPRELLQIASQTLHRVQRLHSMATFT